MHGGGREGAWSTRSAYLVTAELVVATAFQPAVPVLVTWDDEYAWLPTNVSNAIAAAGGEVGGGGNLRHTSPSKFGFELSITKPVLLQIVNQLLPDP